MGVSAVPESGTVLDGTVVCVSSRPGGHQRVNRWACAVRGGSEPGVGQGHHSLASCSCWPGRLSL